VRYASVTTLSGLPETGFVRLKTIVGDSEANPPILPIFPVSCRTWWEGVKDGRYPRPVKLAPRVTAWRVEDIRALIQRMEAA
jgi:prophage regulatory protein